MKYSVIQCVNGNFSIVSEHTTLKGGIVAWHQLCAALWNTDDVITARASLVDENFFVVDGRFTDWFDRTPQPVPPEPESE